MLRASDISVVVAMRLPRLAKIAHTALYALGMRDIYMVEPGRDALDVISLKDPDVLLTLVEGHSKLDEGLALSRRVRMSPDCTNRYIPIVGVTTETTRKTVRAAINAGIHEMVTVPLSAETLFKKMTHSVFIGWPFVETDSYFGPCRRRYQDPTYSGEERRVSEMGSPKASRQDQESIVDDMVMLDI